MSGLLDMPRKRALSGGWTGRLLSAREEMEAWREGEALAREERDRALCSNACLLSRALLRDGEPAFQSGEEVLEAMTAGQIARLAKEWRDFDRECNPAPWDGKAVDRAKKAWSTRLMSAFSGACSACSALCPPKSGRKT